MTDRQTPTLAELREQIDAVDKQLLALYEKRMDISEQIALHKIANHLPVFDPAREKVVLSDRLSRLGESRWAPGAERLFQTLMQSSKDAQQALIDARQHPQKDLPWHVYLIGLPGCGKTTLGKLVAKRLQLPFTDLDAQITAQTRMPISQYIPEFGEPVFREVESACLSATASAPPRIVATGGGTPTIPKNAAKMRESGRTLFIDRPINAVLQDIHFADRPLLQAGETALRALAEARRPIYLSLCDHVLENSGTISDAAEQIATWIERELLAAETKA